MAARRLLACSICLWLARCRLWFSHESARTDIALRTDLMAASHKSLSIPDLMYHSHQVDFDGMRKLCAELMPYEWSHMDEPMVWFEMVRAQARQGLSWFPASPVSTKHSGMCRLIRSPNRI